MSATLNVRVPEEVKKNLEAISKITGRSISEILRSTIIYIAEIKGDIEAIETISKTEEALVKAIIRMPEFQRVLEKLYYMQKTVELEHGWETSREYIRTDVLAEISYEEMEEFKKLANTDEEVVYTAIRKKEDMYVPVLIFDKSEWNSQLTIKYYSYIDMPVRKLAELTIWLKSTARELSSTLKNRIEEIRESIRRLIKY